VTAFRVVPGDPRSSVYMGHLFRFVQMEIESLSSGLAELIDLLEGGVR
jgi:hypothetical protein